MLARLSSLFDPLVRLLLVAILLASVAPVSGAAVPVARLAAAQAAIRDGE